MAFRSVVNQLMAVAPAKLLLASSSARRRELMRAAGYRFEVVPPGESAECGLCSGESPPELVARLAWQKAADVAARFPEGTVIGCDTVAEFGGQALGKPRDEEHARSMLETLSGQVHRVYSGLCVWHFPANEPDIRVARTVLRMDPLSPIQIEAYLATCDWEGKAGAFGYQDGLSWVHVLEGSESNVVGLPLELFKEMLAAVAGP